jgi:hypothetical protein
MTPTQQRVRARIETLIRLAAPGLDLLLAAGDRLARAVDPGEPEAQLTPPLRSRRALGGKVRQD